MALCMFACSFCPGECWNAGIGIPIPGPYTLKHTSYRRFTTHCPRCTLIHCRSVYFPGYTAMITDIILPALFPLALCQRPSNISICDFYTVKRFSENNSTNQYDFVSLLTNTAIIGTYTTPSEFHVPGALAPGDFNGTHIDLMPYFNGSMSSTNRGGKSGVSVNVLGDGGFKSVPGSRPAKTTTSDQL